MKWRQSYHGGNCDRAGLKELQEHSEVSQARRPFSRSGGEVFEAGDTAVAFGLIDPSILRVAFWSGLVPAVNVEASRRVLSVT